MKVSSIYVPESAKKVRHLVHALAHNEGDALKACTRLETQEQHLELVAGIVLLDEVEQAAVNQLGIGGSLLVVDDGFGQELPEARVGIEGLVTAVLLLLQQSLIGGKGDLHVVATGFLAGQKGIVQNI